MTEGARRRGSEAGFTLTELLVVVVILGVIGYALTESIILGLRTTDATAASSSRSVAAQTLTSYFTADAQSAEAVSATDPSCVTEPVFLHLTWTDQGVPVAVSYAFDPADASEQDLIRWSCVGTAPPDRRVIGHFTRDGTVGDTMPVTALCDGVACPAATPGTPAVVTLTIETAPPITLSVRRRTAP